MLKVESFENRHCRYRYPAYFQKCLLVYHLIYGYTIAVFYVLF